MAKSDVLCAGDDVCVNVRKATSIETDRKRCIGFDVRLKRAVFLASLLLATTATVSRDESYDVKLIPQFGERQPRRNFIILTDGGYWFDGPQAPRRLTATLSPRPPRLPDIAWSATGGIRLAISKPFWVGMPELLSEAQIDRSGMVGPFLITAELGAPVNVRATIPGFAYERIALGCAQGNSGGSRYDATGIPREIARPDMADLYIVGPVIDAVATWDRCAAAFHDPSARGFTLHVPGGAILVDADVEGFSAVTARDWKGRTATSFDVSLLHGTLLCRTRDRRLAKILVQVTGGSGVDARALEGATLVADEHDVFADASSAAGDQASPPKRR